MNKPTHLTCGACEKPFEIGEKYIKIERRTHGDGGTAEEWAYVHSNVAEIADLLSIHVNWEK